jgi:hypothetical protein
MRGTAIRGLVDGCRTESKECGTTLLTARSTGAIDHPSCLDAHSSPSQVRVKSHEPSAGKMVLLRFLLRLVVGLIILDPWWEMQKVWHGILAHTWICIEARK